LKGKAYFLYWVSIKSLQTPDCCLTVYTAFRDSISTIYIHYRIFNHLFTTFLIKAYFLKQRSLITVDIFNNFDYT